MVNVGTQKLEEGPAFARAVGVALNVAQGTSLTSAVCYVVLALCKLGCLSVQFYQHDTLGCYLTLCRAVAVTQMALRIFCVGFGLSFFSTLLLLPTFRQNSEIFSQTTLQHSQKLL